MHSTGHHLATEWPNVMHSHPGHVSTHAYCMYSCLLHDLAYNIFKKFFCCVMLCIICHHAVSVCHVRVKMRKHIFKIFHHHFTLSVFVTPNIMAISNKDSLTGSEITIFGQYLTFGSMTAEASLSRVVNISMVE